jgi:prepilin-type processing-associated H-X9-DG protein
MSQGAFLGAFYSPSETVLVCDIKKCFDDGGAVIGPNRQLHMPSEFGSPPAKPANDADDQPVAGDLQWRTRPRGLHNGGCSVAYIDGHAKWDKTEEFFCGQNPTDKFLGTE